MRGRLLRPLSIAVAVLIGGLSVLGCVAMRHSIANERHQILEERAAAVTYLIEATFQEQLSSLKEIGAEAAADPAVAQRTLSAGAKPLLAGQQAVLAVVRPTSRGFRIDGMVGAHQKVGALLAGAPVALAAAGERSLTGATMVVQTPGGPAIGIAVPTSHRVVFVESTIAPTTPISTAASPFNDLGGALYAWPTDRPADLVFTNETRLPITGNASVRTAFLVGDDQWSMYLTARRDLVGTWTAALPWLVLGAGLALAALLSMIIETLSRRQRYAEDLADQRTESLARANHALDDARAFINLLVYTGPLVMMVLEARDGVPSYVSPNIEQRFGITEAAALESDFIGRFVDPLDAAHVRLAVAQAATSSHRTVAPVEFRMQIGDGTARWVEAALVPARNEQLAPGSVFVYVLDIDERHRATEAREVAQAAADAANRSKSDFLSRMSHELRTPLNAILGYAQILELEGLGEEQAQPVEAIITSGRHLLALINEVLDIARIETGRLSLSLEPVSVSDVLDSALNMVRPSAVERGISMFIDTPGCAPFVMADRQRLQQVLLNLLTNAVKYNRPNGSLTVSCKTRGDIARISVSDTGPGISPEQFDRVFAPFERLGAQAGEIEGTGIGLALSRHLAEAMGGTMGLTSAVDEGSTFWVELEVAEALNAGWAPEQIDTAPRVGEISAAETVVLQIEDNPANSRLVERILGRAFGVRLLTAASGSEGLALARAHRPDVILLDLHLPDMTGEAVLSSLRSDPGTASIAVVVISADATPSSVERLKANGATDYLTKPIDVRQLLDIVESTGVSR